MMNGLAKYQAEDMSRSNGWQQPFEQMTTAIRISNGLLFASSIRTVDYNCSSWS